MGNIEIVEDPAAFRSAAADYLGAHALETTIVTTAVAGLLAGNRPTHADGIPIAWFAVSRAADGTVDGVGMRVGEFPPYLVDLDAPTSAALARLILATGERPPGANGDLVATAAFCETLAEVHGGMVTTTMGTRLHRLTALTPPTDVDGFARDATLSDVDLLARWVDDFVVEAHALGTGVDTDEFVRANVDRQTAWIWEVAGEPVCVVMARPPELGVARVGPVYTPPEHRRRGYAAALTASASAQLQERAETVCLFTDLANPTSNAVYRRIGYVPVKETVQRLVTRVDEAT